MEFTDVIRSEEELRALMGDPVAASVVDKTLSRLDRQFPVSAKPCALAGGPKWCGTLRCSSP